jgi:hypothetical protein
MGYLSKGWVRWRVVLPVITENFNSDEVCSLRDAVVFATGRSTEQI